MNPLEQKIFLEMKQQQKQNDEIVKNLNPDEAYRFGEMNPIEKAAFI